MWNWEGGLRPVGAIGAYAPEGRWKKRRWEVGKMRRCVKKQERGMGRVREGG